MMKNAKTIKFIGNIVLLLSLLVAVVAFNISVQNNTNSTNAQRLKTSQQTKLDVALVNEDTPVQTDKREYSLGSSYIKNIERDDSHNWSVVTRGTADKGLKEGRYQLVITIPSDFSQKVLDINNVNVEKTNISYKVNANGNLQVENDANKLAKDVVADLNKQLVDMYMASILSNLYTAQQNVEASSKLQTDNINDYRSNLYGTALTAKDFFPTLVSLSGTSVTANQSLKTSLEGQAKAFETYDTSQGTFGTNFDGLLEQRSQDKISYEAFMAALISMNQSVLGEATEAAYKKLEQSQAALTSKLEKGSQSTGDATETSKALSGNINTQIANLAKGLRDEKSKFDAQRTEIKGFVQQHLAAYYGTSNYTLDQVLGKAQVKNEVGDRLDNQLRASLAQLPSLDPASLNDLNLLNSSTASNIRFSADFASELGAQGNSAVLAELSKAAAALKQNDVAVANTSATGGKAKVTLQVPEGVTVTSWEFAGQTFSDAGPHEVTLNGDNSFKVSYTAAVGKDQNGQAKTELASSIGLDINGVQAATVAVDKAAVANYASIVQKIVSDYEHAQNLMDTYYPVNAEGNRVSLLRSQDMTEVLTGLIVQALEANLDNYQGKLNQTDGQGQSIRSQVDQSLADLEASGPKLVENIESVIANNNELAQEISTQLTAYDNLKAQLGTISKSQEVSTAAQEKTDSNLTSLNSEFKSLITATASVKTSTQQNVSEADSVHETFSRFNQELENAKSGTEKITTSAEDLLGKFNKELEDNGEFVESFVKVLNNAYANGVPNEVLLDFLANPVSQNSSSVRATVNVYRPFTWILLLEIVTLFAAYLFATQNVIRKVKDKFKLDKLQETDLTTVAVLSGLALVIGLVVGVVSASRLSIGKEYIPSWNLLMVFASFILVQGQYLLLKHLRTIGMGLSLFMIISFVYLSNAIGTTANVTGFPAFIKSINILSILEGAFSGYFDGKTAGLLLLFLLFVGILALSLTNILVKKISIFREKEE